MVNDMHNCMASTNYFGIVCLCLLLYYYTITHGIIFAVPGFWILEYQLVTLKITTFMYGEWSPTVVKYCVVLLKYLKSLKPLDF